MNLEVFNRVNWKKSYLSGGRNKSQNNINGMYSKWTALTNKLYNGSCNECLDEKSVLCKFLPSAGKQVTVLIVKQLASSLGITQAPEPSFLTSENEIYWCMEVICYGLTLPLTEHDTVRDCVNVYCEWLSALHPVPKICVPILVCKDANFFARKIIAHFLNLFMPRNGEGSDIINKQAVLCHRVLRTLQYVTQISKNIENETWETLLLFLLTVNDALLAPPTVKDDVGDKLCERVLSVLLEVWLIACIKCYPSPSLWKTLREMAVNWRHRTALIEQWNRINLTLTSKVLEIMYGVNFPQLKIGGDEDLQTTVNNMTEESIVQTWFRILHTVGNPVDLCHSNIISQTPQFLQYAITNDNPLEHPCLCVLPLNFHKAIKGISSIVDSFLGTPVFIQWEDYSYSGCQQLAIYGNTIIHSPMTTASSSGVEFCSPTPPSRRRLAKSFSVTSSKNLPKTSSTTTGTCRSNAISACHSNSNISSQIPLTYSTLCLHNISHFNSTNRNILLSPLRPKCNSILYLFGEWLFEASYNSDLSRFAAPSSITGGINYVTTKNTNWVTSGETGSISSSGSISSFLLRKGSSSQPNSLTTDSSDPDTGTSTPLANSLLTVSSSLYDKFVNGRAEAVGILCRIFCAKKTGEEILPIYLSRFYMIIQQSLHVKEYGECDKVMASVLVNSTNIFSLDLDGVLLLVPYYIEALEIVLPERNLRFSEITTSMVANHTTVGSSNIIPSISNIATSTTVSVTPSSATVMHNTIITTCASTVPSFSTSTTVSTASNSASVVSPLITAAASGISSVTSSSTVSWTTSSTNSFNVNSLNNVTVPTSDSLSDMSCAFNFTIPVHQSMETDCSSAFISCSSNTNSSNIPNVTGSTTSISSNVTNIGSTTNTITTNNSMALVELRKSCIHLLLSILPLSLHFQNLPIKEFGNFAYRLNISGNCNITFGQLRPRLVNLLISALQVETDSLNTHLLLGGLLFVVQDFALCEHTYPSNFSQTDSLNDVSSNILVSDSVHSLFVRSMYLVCHRLISSWKSDLNVSLAALEFLTGLAHIQVREMDTLECKRTVKWLCDFIMYQCSRPPQAHSKDLHSSIVAAFQCVAHWLISHPILLKDKECLNILLEVVELGISGTKSQGKLSEPIRMKDEKELKPVSMRFRDAAEALLTIILEQITDTGTNSVHCLMDEVILLKHCSSLNSQNHNSFTYEESVCKFQYFLFENNVMIALLQEPLGNDQNPQPTITLLIRNSFGRYAWTLQLRHLPRHRSTAKQNYINSLGATTGRPISMAETNFVPPVNQRYFPDFINKIDAYKADKSIPSLDSISGDLNDEKLESLIEQQYFVENEISTKTETFRDCNPPPACHEFYTARMFLCHLGLLSKFRNSNKLNENYSLIALDNDKDEFARELKLLDEITGKTCDTCHIFYVKTGQKRHLDILENAMSRSSVSQNFIELLYSLGWPIEIQKHTGWTGHELTNYKISKKNIDNSNITPQEQGDGICLYDGMERIIYWSDVISEVAFVAPSLRQVSSSWLNTVSWYERNIVDNEINLNNKTNASASFGDKMRTVSLDAAGPETKPLSSGSVFSKKKSTLVTVVMLVWLESYEDHTNFPINELLPYTSTGLDGSGKVEILRDCYIIFLHAMQNGLLKVKLHGPVNRINIATPLVDGMIMSRRSAGQLVRQTVLNICRRRRLDCDSYQLPHVRRRLKLQEIKDKFGCKMDPPELLTYLLKNC